jgi:hypothetical protein
MKLQKTIQKYYELHLQYMVYPINPSAALVNVRCTLNPVSVYLLVLISMGKAEKSKRVRE